MFKEFYDKLFKDGEGVCQGDAYSTRVRDRFVDAEFFSINPLSISNDYEYFKYPDRDEVRGRRADINVTSFRNFMFEMDGTPLEDQLKIFQNSSIPFTSIVFSGSKSYHAVLAVDECVVGETHTQEAIAKYKEYWRRLAAKLDREAMKLGYEYPSGGRSFVDPSCKNPSRFSRSPEFMRSNGNFQSIVLLSDVISKEEFNELLYSCPKVSISTRVVYENVPEDQIESVDCFEAIAPIGLRRSLRIVDWAQDTGMYPTLFRLTNWAIDSTNVSRETFFEYLEKYTFPSLIRRGYPRHKLTIGVEHAFRIKGK